MSSVSPVDPGFEVVGLGSAVLDVLTLVDYFPAGEDVQEAHAIELQGGGPVATALVTLARLGAKTAIVTQIGDDWRGNQIAAEFEAERVSTDYAVRLPNSSSFAASILVRRTDGARTIAYVPATGPAFALSASQRVLLGRTRLLHVNGRFLDACLEAAKIVRRGSGQVSFDGGAHRYQPALRQLLPLVDICIVARDFAEQFSGQLNRNTAAAMLQAAGPELVVITDGINGSWVYPPQQPSFHQPAFIMPQVVDTTGCGDSYHGAFLFGLLRGIGLQACARLASAVAALNTQRLGGRAALPTLSEAESFLATN
jgi:sulfofructose kinase